MKILIDMNISPLWVEVLLECGWVAAHWSAIGNISARDAEILEYAKQHGYIDARLGF